MFYFDIKEKLCLVLPHLKYCFMRAWNIYAGKNIHKQNLYCNNEFIFIVHIYGQLFQILISELWQESIHFCVRLQSGIF